MNEASSEYYRFAVVRAALDRLEGARWVYGFGPGTFYMADVRSEYAGQDHVLTAGDCQYALTLVEIGTVGLGIMIVMMTAGVLICTRAVRVAHWEIAECWLLLALRLLSVLSLTAERLVCFSYFL